VGLTINKTEDKMTDAQKIKIARKAILKTLQRIQRDKDVAYHLGSGTNTFSLLTAAASVLCDQPQDEVMNAVIPGSSDITHDSVAEILESIESPEGGAK
jgi:calcineurin-like phosphoesterase family protein